MNSKMPEKGGEAHKSSDRHHFRSKNNSREKLNESTNYRFKRHMHKREKSEEIDKKESFPISTKRMELYPKDSH